MLRGKNNKRYSEFTLYSVPKRFCRQNILLRIKSKTTNAEFVKCMKEYLGDAAERG